MGQYDVWDVGGLFGFKIGIMLDFLQNVGNSKKLKNKISKPFDV